MTFKELFQEAIIESDWEAIRTIYTQLTDEEAPYPKKAQEFTFEKDETLSIEDLLNQEVVIAELKPTKIPPKKKRGRPPKKKTATKKKPAKEKVVKKEVDDIEDFRMEPREQTPGKYGIKEPIDISNKTNEFFDDGTEHADEKGIALTRGEKIGNRDAYEPIEVVCSVCGKVEFVNESLASTFSSEKDKNTYKCNQCTSSKRRRN